jgi:peroxiredoxin
MHLRLGLLDEAEELARDAAKDAEGEAVPHANLAFGLAELGEREEALEVFAKVRATSARFDLETPPFERLAPLAAAAGHGADWRVPFELPDDVGDRPDLDTLGPMRWSPPAALAWTCEDAQGRDVSLADYRGRPVVVILFLGFGCLHCVEQLEAFAPVAADFAEAGIEIVSIGTDSREDIAESLKTFAEGEAPPFPVLADPELKVFHAYRAYDDFEDLSLHGTYLVDGKGRVRWQDISFEPFVDHEFLLAEAKRLLGLPDSPMAVSASAPAEATAGGGR